MQTHVGEALTSGAGIDISLRGTKGVYNNNNNNHNNNNNNNNDNTNIVTRGETSCVNSGNTIIS